jgi:antitoxin component YwqK of YwqJK toxin-antitoxin module
MWYQNGRKKMEGNYENGKKHGLSTMWHLNGSKWREQKHIQGEPSGYWRTWDERGELIEEIDQETNN